MNFLQDIPMKYFAVSFFDNSAAAQNHGIWAVEKAYLPSTRFFYEFCSAKLGKQPQGCGIYEKGDMIKRKTNKR